MTSRSHHADQRTLRGGAGIHNHDGERTGRLGILHSFRCCMFRAADQRKVHVEVRSPGAAMKADIPSMSFCDP